MEPIIEFENFTFKYRSQMEPTLRDINLKIYPGEKVLIIGPSGSGKSTLSNCINGLIPFSYEGDSTGTLKIEGKDPKKLGIFGLSKMVGTVLQDTDGQFIGLTVAEDIAFVLENDCMAQEEMFRKVDDVAETVEVKELLHHAPSEMSGGQKQRVAIARALANDPKVLLCDEATSALDPQTTGAILQLLKHLNERLGITIVIITHEMAVVKEICDRVAVMEHGNVVEEGDVFSIFAAPKAGITRDFIRTTSNLQKIEKLIEDKSPLVALKPGEKILLSDGKGTNCLCEITELFPDKVLAKILPEEVDDTELPVQVTLYQGLPKADKMEFIIQKCVELGVTKIVPVDTDRAVVKLDAKKEEAKRKRWYGISESAAKQSKRMIVPEIGNVMKFKAAIEAAKMDDLAIIPYEDSESLPGAGGMALTRELIGSLKPGQKLSIFIGPEGGFSDGEVEIAMNSGVRPVTLGKRILRTETAGMFVMAAVGLLLES